MSVYTVEFRRQALGLSGFLGPLWLAYLRGGAEGGLIRGNQ